MGQALVGKARTQVSEVQFLSGPRQAAELKAAGLHHGSSGNWVFNARVQRVRVHTGWRCGLDGLKIALVLVGRSKLDNDTMK